MALWLALIACICACHMRLSQTVTAKRLSQDAPSLLVACGLALRRFDA